MSTLYVNGDSHAAAGEAVNSYCFAEDDPQYRHLGRAPHPDNLAASWGTKLAGLVGCELHCEAESASSNERIIRTTREYLSHTRPDAIVIGWSTWERQEWLHDGVYWQINAGGVGHDWPEEIKVRYTHWVLSHNPEAERHRQHDLVLEFHRDLREMGIPHLFFNTYGMPYTEMLTPPFWNGSYLTPYFSRGTYFNRLRGAGFNTVRPDSYHFGADAHAYWGNQLFAIGGPWLDALYD